MSMADAELSNFFPFSVANGGGVANVVANSAFQFITKDSILKVKAVIDAAAVGMTIQCQITDDNVPKTPYPAAQIPIAQTPGSITEFDPVLATVRVKRGANVVITLANGSTTNPSVGRVWVGLA